MFSLQNRLSQLSTVYSMETPFFGVIKQAIRLSGLDISTEVLTPVERLSNEKTLKLVEVMRRAGIKV